MSDDIVRVLAVDDDQSIVETIRLGLEAEGMEVLGADGGASALDVLRREPVDVVVLDIMMPDVDGWMVLMEMRNDPLTKGLPVIVLTAKDEDLAKVHAFRQGAQQYVTKPFSMMELAARVDSLASSRPAMGDGLLEPGQELRKLAVRKAGRTVLLDVTDIVFASAKNKSTYVHTYENQYIVDMTLAELESRLSAGSFHRVHRSYIIGLDAIREIVRAGGSYTVLVSDRDETQVPVARRNVKEFRAVVGI